MKYLKKYKIFESEIIPQDMVDDIRDILVELEDEGRIKTSISSTSGKFKKYISFYLSDHIDYDGFLFEEISYYVFWLKRYLGDNFKSCSALFIRDKNISSHALSAYYKTYRTTIDLEDEKDINKLKYLPIDNLIIEIK